MSVLAYNSVADNNEATQKSISNSVDVTANISANARIDYILRFSKQLVLAVTPNVIDYAPINSQFLANLPHSHNAAFVAASNQFNNIQIRSRIIEQLFTNILFDPEQSLAVSLINLTQEKPQDISIAIEHGQYLSTQILHELTQLAAIAQKSGLTINILVTGDYSLGHKLSQSSVLFKGKSSIINGITGQIIPLNSSLFKKPTVWFSVFYLKISAIILSFLIVLLLVLYFYNQDKQGSIVNQSMVEPAFVKIGQPTVLIDNKNIVNSQQSATNTQVAIAANANDIMNALLFKELPKAKTANQTDILHALTVKSSEQSEINQPVVKENVIPDTIEPIESTINNNESNSQFNIEQDTAIYFSIDTGFVIQFAAFAESKVKDDFIQLFPNLIYHRYHRKIDGKTFEVFTSKPYITRQAVDEARAQLPESVTSLNVWVKSLNAIQEEIIEFQN